MNEPTVSDERVRCIELLCDDDQFYPAGIDRQQWKGNLAGHASSIAAICRELLARRETESWAMSRGVYVVPNSLGWQIRVSGMNAEYDFEREFDHDGYFQRFAYRNWKTRREADRLAEIAKRVPSDEELRMLAERSEHD